MTKTPWHIEQVPVRDSLQWNQDWAQQVFESAGELQRKEQPQMSIASWTYPRGSGQTSRQMIAAPEYALYIVGGEDTNYFTKLAKNLGRGDLHIQKLAGILSGYRLRSRLDGTIFGGMVLDHALTMSDGEKRELLMATRGCRFRTSDWMNPEPNYIEQGTDEWIVTVAPIEPE